MAIGPEVAAAWTREERAVGGNFGWLFTADLPDRGSIQRDDGLRVLLRPARDPGRCCGSVWWPEDPEVGRAYARRFAGSDAVEPQAIVSLLRPVEALVRELDRRIRRPALLLWPQCQEWLDARARERAERLRVADLLAGAMGQRPGRRHGDDLYLHGYAPAGAGHYEIRVMPGGSLQVKASLPAGSPAPLVAELGRVLAAAIHHPKGESL